MGLDMYLSKRRYVKNWDYMKPENKHTVTLRKAGKLVKDKLPVKEIVYDAGYWRKANAIHNWFVDNVQGGEDDCKEYWVSPKQLEELLNICKKVLKVAKTAPGKVHTGTRWTSEKGEEKIYEDGIVVTNPEEVAELLPPQGGFFFGSTEIDGYYLDDVRETVKILNTALEDTAGCDFYYRSSW